MSNICLIPSLSGNIKFEFKFFELLGTRTECTLQQVPSSLCVTLQTRTNVIVHVRTAAPNLEQQFHIYRI